MEVEQPIMEQTEEKIVSRKRKVSKGNCYTFLGKFLSYINSSFHKLIVLLTETILVEDDL